MKIVGQGVVTQAALLTMLLAANLALAERDEFRAPMKLRDESAAARAELESVVPAISRT